MDDDLKQALIDAQEPVCAFGGRARDAVRLFPDSANIAGLIALATIGFDRVDVEIWGDPTIKRARHELSASGAAGDYYVSIENNLAPDNPRTSAVTAYAVLRELADRKAWTVVG
jgi:aspartate dehydrogenase